MGGQALLGKSSLPGCREIVGLVVGQQAYLGVGLIPGASLPGCRAMVGLVVSGWGIWSAGQIVSLLSRSGLLSKGLPFFFTLLPGLSLINKAR